MEANRRRVVNRRKPLSDCTNLPSSSSSSVKSQLTNSCSSSSALNKTAAKTTNSDNATNPTSPSPPVPHTPTLKTPSLHGTGDVEGVVDVEASEPISVVYSRSRRPCSNKRRMDKGKGVAVRVSTTPNLKISDTRKKNDEFEGANLPKAKALTAPPRKKQRAMSSEKDAFKDSKLQAFIEERKAYFKEIDDFELEVEVESGDD